MPTKRYTALLRAINVGGRNKVPMADLRACFEDAGYRSVSTYIASGNVFFASDAPRAGLVDDIEAMLATRFGFEIPVAVRSDIQIAHVVDGAPPGFGDLDTHHCDTIFLRDGLTPARALAAVRTKDGVDDVWAGTGVLYFQRLSERRSSSHLSKFTQEPEYKHVTIRSWSTTLELLERVRAVEICRAER